MVAEPIHALTYFAPESHGAFEAAGLRGFWRGYFAGRAAPLGAVDANVVVATFFGFHPDFVRRAVPQIWATTTPARAIDARREGARAALRRLAGVTLTTHATRVAVGRLREAIERTSVAGLPLFAANAELDWPGDPVGDLWHAVTLLREHRGDGHVNALSVAELDACEAHALRIADDGIPVASIQPYRGWSAEDWTHATQRLRAREVLDDDGRTTRRGRELRARIEADTDRLTAVLVDRVAEPELVLDALTAIAATIAAARVIPYPNPVGVPDASARSVRRGESDE